MIIEKWKQCDAYIQGISHKGSGDPCQDRTFALTENGVMAIALSDGAGSRRFSHIGAEVATQSVCKLLCDRFDELIAMCEKDARQNAQLVDLVLKHLLKALDKAAIDNNVALADLSSTLLFFAAKDELFIQGHIGDGAIGIWSGSDKGAVEVASKPENGAQPNITFFITDTDASSHLRIMGGQKKNLYGVLLMSDGTADLLYEKAGVFNENTVNLFSNYKQVTRDKYQVALSEFLEKTVSQFSDDDLSVNLLYKESLSTADNIPAAYIDYMLNGIRSKEQIVDLGLDGKLLKNYAKHKKVDFASVKAIKEYLEW